jgi:hypothetical protein
MKRKLCSAFVTGLRGIIGNIVRNGNKPIEIVEKRKYLATKVSLKHKVKGIFNFVQNTFVPNIEKKKKRKRKRNENKML